MKRAACLVIVSVLSGCDDGGGGDGGGDPVPLSDLAAELGAATCAKMVECCTVEELEDQLLGASTLEECEAFYLGFLGQLFIPVMEDSVADGRLRYDGDETRRCIDAVAVVECADFPATLRGGLAGSCSSPFTGLVELAGECANDADCVSTLCDGDRVDFEGNVTMGVCARRPGNGEACADGDECGAGLYCDTSGASDLCAPTLADGTTCRFDDDCTAGSCLGNDNGGMGTCGASMACDGL
ncbi:MAG TPA: Dickkopf N-terminal cysteine-rich domain-containing protein [Kofleriaceae bacterium]|nr:Dickkopf N-terminal cysteine-rich domain-containing protein [Kofleriaceae bacterium]